MKTSEATIKCGWILLPHLPYSLDLARSYFHLFGAQKHAIHSTKFKTDDNNVIRTKTTWLREQDKAQYQQSQHTLVPHWHKAVKVDKDFVEIKGMESNHHSS
jgi:hypothetical protein